jgi:DNA (cytosine-5)-methyltransferase 1
LGYRATAGVFSAAEVGAPHQRKRVFIYARHLPYSKPEGSQRSRPSEQERRSKSISLLRNRSENAWPSRPGQEQYSWEPPRVMANPENTDRGSRVSSEEAGVGSEEFGRGLSEQSNERQAQPPVGRDVDGLTDRLDYTELYSTCDNRTDELRLLGNGVVPDTAERAFRVLSTQLAESQSK